MKEILIYGIGFTIALLITLGLFGALDKDKENPFKSE